MSRLFQVRRVSAFFLILGSLLAVGFAGDAAAQATGVVKGRVMVGKEPGGFANVIVLGTRRGAQTDDQGNFTITAVPVGTHQLRVQLPGYEARQQSITVNAGANDVGSINLGSQQKVVKEIEEVRVTAQRLIDTKSSTTKQTVTGEALNDLPVENLQEAVGLKAGVVATGGELHVRGGRSGEIKYQVDGIEVSNPLFGNAASIANLSVAGADVLTGGIDAEYGNALSGIVNISTREGGDKFGGEVQWHTDRYGENTKTYNNYDRFTVGLGGPTPVKNLTYFLTYEGVFSDTYLDAGMTRSTRTVFDFITLGNRQSNQINTNMKLAFRPRGTQKLTFEAINNHAIQTPYNHMWSRKGYVSVTTDESTGRDIYGRWSFFQEDSTFRYENLADHVPTTDNRFQQLKAVWTHSLTPRDVYTVRLSRFKFDTETTVASQEPWEYQIQSPGYWFGNQEFDPFFATHGDFPVYANQATTTWTGKGDYTTTRWKGHTFKAGLEAVYNAVELVSMQFPNQEAQGLPGLNRSDFTNYNPEGSMFVQDRWEYEGLVLNAGLRYDIFTPGPQIPDEDLPNGRYKRQISPRLGVAYPISDRDVLSFHYGWTFQTPQRSFVFENRGSQSTVAVRGNPDLEPETNISYQAAVQHLFSKDVSGQFAVFFKDIFGLISVRQEIDPLTGLLVPVFVNQDYASARGFEASLVKRFSHKFSTEVNYTYSIATGVASDPNTGLQFANGNLLYLPISEQALDWDQRHTLNANLILRDPGKWGVSFLWTFGSGLPYTPTFRNDRRPDPKFTNTRRQPSISVLSIIGDKYFRIWGQNVTFFVDARNVLDSQSIANLAPSNFPNPYINQVGNDYLIYYTETGRAGGAYLKDTNGDREDDWVAVNDPRVFSEGRNIRIGIGVTF
ncbi:MAG: TonB-dependent receptor [Candidatus Eiseniibacteriota bacterium]